MRIAIVDDDSDFLAQSARMLALVLEDRGMRATVERFGSAEALSAVSDGTFDLYFLDVLMPGESGVKLARRIRRSQPEVPIVFFTTSPDFALEAYAVEASGYVVKPFSRAAFERAFDRACRLLPTAGTSSLTLKSEGGYVNVPTNEIVFVEAGGRYQVVHVLDGRTFVLNQSMQELEGKLQCDRRFLRIGRQYIVNLAHVTDFAGSALTVVGGRRIDIPRRTLAEVRAAFRAFFSA